MSRDQTPPPVPKFDAATARRFLSYILDTEAGVCEIRIFRAWLDRSGYIVPSTRISSVVAGWYDSIHEMIVDLGKLRGVSAYITINPVVSDLFARCANKLRDAKNTTNDGNIVAFRWLYIDIDPKRPADISSTDAELAAAVEVRDRILDDHPALAQSAIWGKSGNGAWILVMLPDYLPEKGHDLATQALGWIAATYSDEAVKIDVSTKNPSRVGCIPGTVKCKGDHVPDRPHRLATLDSPDHDADNPLLPCDLRAWIESVGADQVQAAQSARVRQPKANGDGDHLPARKPRGGVDQVYRAAAYIDAMKPAVSGQGGHGQTFDAACSLIHGFGLTIDEARPIFYAYCDRCMPPWSIPEREHKLKEADEHSDHRPRGYLLDAGREHANGNGNGHANGDANGCADGVIPMTRLAKSDAVVEISTVEKITNDAVCDLLYRYDGLFQRNYRLVEVAHQPKPQPRRRVAMIPAGMPMISEIEGPRLREIISVVASFRDEKRKPAHPPDWCVSALNKRKYWEGVPILTSVVEHPVLRPDGSMIDKPGYDEETGILWVSDHPMEPIPDRPTQDDARQAAQRLLSVVEEFPFQGDAHKAAWLACLLTILNRHLIDDAVPLFLFEATTSGSGKTLLCDLISRIITGRDMIRSAYYHDPVEMDKQIVSAALGAIRITMLDNVEGAFGNSSLDNALTARWYRGRILGVSAMSPPLLLDTTFIATGNNISFHGDIFRRIVPCRLESPYERPDKDKTDYKIADIREYVLAHRTGFLRDALIISRAYFQADSPCTLPTNVYAHWTRIIRGMVVWTLGLDPWEGQGELVEADASRMSRAGLLEGFVEMLYRLNRYEMTGGEILNSLKDAMYRDRFDIIREAISSIWPKGDLPGPGSLGRKLMSMRGSRAGHFRLLKTGLNKHTAKWGVQYWNKDTQAWVFVDNWHDVTHLLEDMDICIPVESNLADSANCVVDMEENPY